MPAKLNISRVKELLEAFDFRRLLIEELGWNNPTGRGGLRFLTSQLQGDALPIAELGGVQVLLIESEDLPDASVRKQVHAKIKTLRAEHLLIFTDPARTRACWSWVKVEDKKQILRDHYYFKGQPGDAFISKIANLAVDFSELDPEGNLGLMQAHQKVRDALDTQRLIKRFYTRFQEVKDGFVLKIEGIDDAHDRGWYASVLLNRLMFIYFLQKGRFLDEDNVNYLEHKLEKHGEDFYPVFLQALFFEAFAKPNPSEHAQRLCGKIPYLNGGLFIPHRLEQKYKGKIRIPEAAFTDLLALFGGFTWTFNDIPGDPNEEINPDVLGYIFEKYINQKEFGAYYTPTAITDYLCQQTIEQLVLDKIAAKSKKKFTSAGDMLLRLNADETHFLLTKVLPSISLLDPACGSGAFLFAAQKSMMALYTAAIGRIDAFNDEALNQWRSREFAEHRSVHYWLKKKIITDNLYGVDIMEEATEIAKLRLFMALVSSAKPGEPLEPLPNIDFNILTGNSLIGLMRVEDEAFDKNRKKTASLFGAANSYSELVAKKATLTARYRHPSPGTDIAAVRAEIDELDAEAGPILDDLLLSNFHSQNVKFEQASWDASKGKEGKPTKRSVTIEDIRALNPFHWGYQFHERMGNGRGFDAIITNPPWETLKPQDKEFFEKVSSLVTKNKMTIKDFEKQKASMLKADPKLRAEYEAYLSQFPHQSAYFRSAPEYDDQSAIVNGKRTGTDINLYKLFTERCFELLRPAGLCGLVIPGSVYKDLGATGLRRMLFARSEVKSIVGLSNEKFIFDAVHHAYPLCIMSFCKLGETTQIESVFRIDPREAISKDNLETFLQSRDNRMLLPLTLVRSMSPEAEAIAEFKSELDVQIAQKMLKCPLLGERVENTWNLKLTREFDMTNDSHLFHTSPGPGRLPLLEGKMMQQFECGTSPARYWIDEQVGRSAILGRRADTGQSLGYQNYRFCHRAVAGGTNLRTMISTVMPKGYFFGHSLNASAQDYEGQPDLRQLLALTVLMNSFVVDSSLRRTVTNNITQPFVMQLRIPRLTASDSRFAPVVARSARLICTTEEFADLWNEVMADPTIFAAAEATVKIGEPPITREWTPICGATQTAHRARLRAELDGLIAHLYELTDDEFAHILTTFPLVPEHTKTAARNAYEDVKLGVIP